MPQISLKREFDDVPNCTGQLSTIDYHLELYWGGTEWTWNSLMNSWRKTKTYLQEKVFAPTSWWCSCYKDGELEGTGMWPEGMIRLLDSTMLFACVGGVLWGAFYYTVSNIIEFLLSFSKGFDGTKSRWKFTWVNIQSARRKSKVWAKTIYNG